MARDAKGRWLPNPTEDDGRHYLSRLDRQKGFEAMMRKPMPSRLRASIRKRIRGYYQGRNRKTPVLEF